MVGKLTQRCRIGTCRCGNAHDSKGRKVDAGGKFDAYYWRYVEFGTSRMAARPFLRPSFEVKKEEAIGAITEYIANRFPQEAAQLGWRYIKP